MAKAKNEEKTRPVNKSDSGYDQRLKKKNPRIFSHHTHIEWIIRSMAFIGLVIALIREWASRFPIKAIIDAMGENGGGKIEASAGTFTDKKRTDKSLSKTWSKHSS